MTHTMAAALGPSGIGGDFSSGCEEVLRVLRSARESTLALLEAFAYDPPLE